jgi:predicted TPR repeat methyltransferase|uniref:Class I SAM-dependent methyltransferase n=1 Tax=candidate division WOR-3 bacterium TaxID=2052148 RepID=A0A7C6EBP4_UNCW3
MTQPVEPFTDFAPYYDSFMLKCVDYEGWVKYIEKIFKQFKFKPKTILDLACGTGIPTILLAKRGYQMIGVDRAKAMLEILKKKSKGYNIITYEADIRDFTLPEPADACICLYDSINYLLTEEDLEQCFKCVRRGVKKGGLFIFDMNTIYGLKVFWGNRESVREAGNVNSVWHNTYDETTAISTLYLTCQVKDENRTFLEIHKERAYDLPLIQKLLFDCGFSLVNFYHHGTFIPPTPFSVRVMVVAK